MKKNITTILIGLSGLMLSLAGVAQSPSFKTYMNPVIPGDHSDCTLTKIGKDFYTTGSSFNPTPVIYHSTDLVHWEAIAQPVSAAWPLYGDNPTGGCWGGQMVFYNNKYWDFFSRANTMYFVTANKPQGPWSMPVKINNPPQLPFGLGYDNSVFIDDNGKWYLVVKNGQSNNAIVELNMSGQPTGVVYNLNWLNPGPPFKYSWAEGPVMWKHNGYYYYSFARDVSGGQKVMRSKILTADKSAWTTPVDLFNENDPNKDKSIFFNPNHCSAVVELKDGTSWLLHPLWARANNNEWYGQGRQGLLNQVRYDSDNNAIADYPTNTAKKAPLLPSSGIPWMVPKSDFFNEKTLSPEWSFLGYTPNSLYSLTARPGWLRLFPKSPTKANTVIKTDAEHNYSLITRLDFNPKSISDEAGIRIINGMEDLFAKIYCTVNNQGQKIICFSFNKARYEVANTFGNTVWLKLVRDEHELTGFFSSDGIKWKPVGHKINVETLDRFSRNYNGWSGNRQGLYVQGANFADFDLYIYRDAYTPILAACPANQFGTTNTVLPNGIALLDNIHNNDWALYAGVEFGDKGYEKISHMISISASCITKGGNVEVWLDSIGTGKKIATCKIMNTGSLANIKTFTARTIPTTGRHDVYLKFTGDKAAKLFVLKDFVFTE
ncbi:family 43 glycosylhydrolase [Microbacter margulisiae]|uniref:Beta-xylosidase n=1 Tax=Microbacter margulisiae TaxID=1350067 RepID=A0A7W5DS97_9PORP|nr:family 43 glycosylhydrolase [Microbacter margulisiae]MBB3188129.1 beta-xylosidase [Microbacter margulisiae]